MAGSPLEIDTSVEQNAQKIAPWLGGYFEVGGIMAFNLDRDARRGKTYAYPFIVTGDENTKVALTFKGMFEGSVTRHYNSLNWRASGMRAYIIASTFAAYAPSRKEFMEALTNWANSDLEERVQIAKEMKGYNRFEAASVENYESLTSNPDFLAGVIDNRGTILLTEGRTKLYPRLDVNSSNRPLLDNLVRHYGGRIIVADQAGDSRMILGRTTKLTRDSIYWRPTSASAIEIFDLIMPHLKFKGDRVREVLSLGT